MYCKTAEHDGPPKITSVVHCPDEVLLKEPDVKLGHKNKLVWSTVEHNNRCFGDDRVFDKIIAQSEAHEAEILRRKKKLKEYFAKPQRGTQRSKQMFEGQQQQEASQYNYDIPVVI